MITVVTGHRGTGKTELMKRLQLYLRDQSVDFVDLDNEIEKKIGKTIPELFMQHGEEYFRDLERQLFLEILQRKTHESMYIVLGAGFDLSVVPDNVRVLWVRRRTDLDGRIFLNRPRLNPEMSPLEEFQKRGRVREVKYRERADEIYLMPEGVLENRHQAMAVEKSVLFGQLHGVGGTLTVLPELFATENRWSLFKSRYADRGIDLIELRDDLLSFEQILRAVNEMPQERFVYSFRKPATEFSEDLQSLLVQVEWVDWPWELGAPDPLLAVVPREKLILSLHTKDHYTSWIKYEDKVAHLKYAPEVLSFAELEQGHQWQKESSSKRSFLPRSAQARWDWYRLLQKGNQLLNFWKEGDGSAGDQPSLWSWLMMPMGRAGFAAVLGDPVAHSFTPVEHSDYFYRKSMPVFAVQIYREEWNEALPVLQRMGLTHAAVTSPHKENAAVLCKHAQLRAVNTLYWNGSQWLGTSTDDQGFLELIEGVGMIAPLQKEIFVWGGGGTLEMIHRHLPHASYFSSRTGEPRQGSEDALSLKPKILIWAAPRSAETVFPPAEWSPAMVFDLNYKEDSMGREYAQRSGSNYQSGLVMFTAQAQGQRTFWKNCEEQR
ncbi:shikimate kinase [Bdellovibrio sp. 22V]|uniref:shikimate kinase n=1 Tax=Bdellovibrio sp. 22V TaxID=3044166 RepID=UPI0025429E48|nr:shikimate kinase [Bdellovibrio sp. 22V]WII72481.1 shikimate kinase [Bdellovibrio sp. 22V]